MKIQVRNINEKRYIKQTLAEMYAEQHLMIAIPRINLGDLDPGEEFLSPDRRT